MNLSMLRSAELRHAMRASWTSWVTAGPEGGGQDAGVDAFAVQEEERQSFLQEGAAFVVGGV